MEIGTEHISNPFRLYLVDDDEDALSSLATSLSSSPNILLVGQSSSGGHALETIPSCAPDAVLMDVSMPQLNGFETTIALKQRIPNLIVILMSATAWFPYRTAAFLAGADAFLSKSECIEEVIATLTSCVHNPHAPNVR